MPAVCPHEVSRVFYYERGTFMSYTTKFALDGYRESFRSGNLSKGEYNDCIEEVLLDEYQAGRITASQFFKAMHRYYAE